MSDPVEAYRAALIDYTSYVTVPGLDVPSDPIRLDQVFLEPSVRQARPQDKFGSPHRSPRSMEDETEGTSDRKQPPVRATDLLLPEKRRVAIVGEPGQGKSTLLRQFARTLAEDTDGPIPVLVELGRVPGTIQHAERDLRWLSERIPPELRHHLQEVGWSVVCKAIGDGQATILCDAFDELERDGQKEVSELVPTLDQCRVVVSSRPRALDLSGVRDIVEFRLEELTSEQVRELQERVCAAIAAQLGVPNHESTLKTVRDAASGMATPIARNPLFLSFMCLTALRRQAEARLDDFPTRAAPLIGECIEVLVWHQAQKVPRTWPIELSTQRVIRILAPLALTTFQNRRPHIAVEDVSLLASEDERLFRDHLVRARFVERRNGSFVFPLETFREYFAAQAIARSPDPFSLIKDHLHHPRWEQVILRTAGSLRNEEGSPWAVEFPGLCRTAVRLVSPAINVAVAWFGLSGWALSGEAFKAARDEFGTDICNLAESWLARSNASIEYFITAISRQRSPHERLVRRDLKLALRCIGAAGIAPRHLALPLVRMATTSYLGRSSASVALSEVTTSPVVKHAALDLTRDANRIVRVVATLALKPAAAQPDVSARLLEITHDPEYAFRWAATETLRPVAAQPDVCARLLDLTHDPYNQVRQAAIWALVEPAAAQPDVCARLLEITRDPDDGVRSAAAEALEPMVAQPDVWARLLEITHDPDDGVRWAAIETLRPVAAQPDVWARLLDLTRDPNDGVRSAASWALQGAAYSITHEMAAAVAQLAEDHEEARDALEVLLWALAEKDDLD